MKALKLTLRTKEGCMRLLAYLLAIVLIANLFAALIASDFGGVKMSRVTIDARGAVFSGDLYIPAGTSDDDALPAIAITHGRGVTRGVFKSFAEELARRGFVVLNADAYGVGLSEMPVHDELGQGEDVYDFNQASLGVLDAVNYLRSLAYVDATRVGVIGQSGGARRVGVSAIADCGYFTFNDIMLNVLYDTFGVQISEAQLYEDADTIAQQELSSEQLNYYQHIREEEFAAYDSRLKAVCLLGNDAGMISLQQTVQVAGHDVSRSCQTSFCIINGGNDFFYRDFPTRDTTKVSLYLGSSDMEQESWYLLNDQDQTSTIIGNFRTSSVASDEAFAQALEDGVTRLYVTSGYESHSKGFFSTETTANAVHYFEQRLNYNRGDLTDPSTIPLDAGENVFILREVCNGIAMLAMLALIFPVCALVLNCKNAQFALADSATFTYTYDKRQYWFFALVTVAVTFVAVYLANIANMGPTAKRYLPTIFPLVATYRGAEVYLLYVAIACVVLLAVYAFLGKRSGKGTGFDRLGIRIPLKRILQYLGTALAALAFCYTLLLVTEYLFNEDFRFWMAAFTDMKVEYWAYAAAFAVIFTPLYAIIGAAVNYSARTDIPAGRDDLLCVLINSAGVWLCALIQIISMYTVQQDFSSFMCTYQLLLIVPVTIFISRKTYRMTGSIWLGTFVNALFVSWAVVCGAGFTDSYQAIGFFSRLFAA